MPVIRMPADTSLGDTLGNLGRSLTEGLNPLNRLRGLDIQQQIWLRNQQLMQAQREANAKRLAIQHYGHLVPPEALPEIANMIYQNAPPDQIGMRAAQLSGRLVDDPSDAGTNRNIQTLQRDFGVQWKEAYPPVAGAATQANRLKVEAAQAGATTGAQKQAETDVQIKNAPGIAEAEGLKAGAVAQGQTIAKQNAIDALTKAQVDDPAHNDTNRQIAIAIEALGGPKAPEPGFTVPVGPNTNAIYQTERSKQAGSVKEAEATAQSKVTGVDPTKPVMANPLINQPAAPAVSAPAVSAPAASTSAPAVSAPAASASAPAPIPAPVQAPIPQGATPDPTRPGWYWQGGQLHPGVTTGGPQGTVFGTQPGDIDAAKQASDEAAKTLNDAFAAGDEKVMKLKTITGQIRALEQVSRTGGLVGQVTAGPLREVLDKVGLANVTTAQQAQTLEMNLLKNELPSAIKQANMTRVAQPEINAVSTMTGTANLPPGVLDGILANVDNGVDYTLKRKGLAGQALGYDKSQPINYPEFQQQDTSLLNNYQADAEKRRANYGAISATPAATAPAVTNPPPPQTASGGSPITDALAAVAHWFTGGGSQAAPSTTPAPNSVELDPNTGLPKAQ